MAIVKSVRGGGGEGAFDRGMQCCTVLHSALLCSAYRFACCVAAFERYHFLERDSYPWS